jgi:lipoyl(octanoyl) transferase
MSSENNRSVEAGKMGLVVRHLGQVDYEQTWHDMQRFTDERTEVSADELWVLQHPPVYTLGKNGKPEHVLNPQSIPVINVDRGGQVTYHGPGQIVIYTLLDLNRLKIGVRELVTILESSIVELLAGCGIEASARRDAPGVYVNGDKIAALGLRVRRGCSFHGLAFNIDMDLEPFTGINPCGYEGLNVTQLKDLVEDIDLESVVDDLLRRLKKKLNYE